MLGISYGELFLLIGATAALVGPKDLPRIARTAGSLAGRAIGYVQLARGQFENVMQQSQARQVHKELQDTIAQLEAIRYEIRSISIMNPGPLTRRLMENSPDPTPGSNGNSVPEKREEELKPTNAVTKDYSFKTAGSTNLHSQATAYARLAESAALESGSLKSSADIGKLDDEAGLLTILPVSAESATKLHSQATVYARLAESAALESDSLKSSADIGKLDDEAGLLTILPVSAESAGLLPNRKDSAKGSDIVLEAILEAEVAYNAKDFFSQPQNQIQCE